MNPIHKIIIDTDPGIDDAQAIAFAIAHPEIELLALTTVFGNADIETTTRNALSILELLDASHVTVARGAGDPLTIDRFDAPDFVHGTNGLGDIRLPEPSIRTSDLNAAELMVELVNDQPGQITIVAIGPLTNLAQAIAIDPDFSSKVKQVSIMGGTVSAPGNVSPVAEANFINDPHAADIVLGENWPVTLLGLDVTMQICLHDSDLASIRSQHARVGGLMWDSSRHYVNFYKEIFPQPQPNNPCTPMHDATALVFLVNPSLFELESGAARVACEGIALGQVILDTQNREYFFPYWQQRPQIKAAIKVHSEAVKDVFVDVVINYDW